MVLAFCGCGLAFSFCLYLLVGVRTIISSHWKLLCIAAPLFLILNGLGVWQVTRWDQKRELLSRLEHAQSLPYHPLGNTFQPTPYERVTLKGHFAKHPPFLLSSKPYQGKVGTYVLSPFINEDGSWILVLRGWTRDTPTTPSTSPHPYTLRGQVRIPSPPRWFEPENRSPKWFRIDPSAMSQDLPQTLKPFYILESDPPPPFHSLPQVVNIPNNHLSYIITWFGLAFALCVMVFVYIRKESHRVSSNNNS